MNLVSSAVLQVARIEVVVLDRVARPREVRVLEARDGAHEARSCTSNGRLVEMPFG